MRRGLPLCAAAAAAAAVTAAGLSEHPVAAFLAQQLLAEVLACGCEELLLLQLSGLLQLLQAAAACAALPGADSAMHNGTHALVDTMSTVLQVGSLELQSLLAGAHACLLPLQGCMHFVSGATCLSAV
jgi:hypothetical protein